MKKIVTLKELKAFTEEKKSSSKVVGLCHGVFDLLHLGHIYYLEEAKSLCDFLIVTITDDQFVNKGPGRPHFNAMERAKALSSLEHVDYVAVNQWKTALKTLKFIRPSLYIKGPDYKDSSYDMGMEIASGNRCNSIIRREVCYNFWNTVLIIKNLELSL